VIRDIFDRNREESGAPSSDQADSDWRKLVTQAEILATSSYDDEYCVKDVCKLSYLKWSDKWFKGLQPKYARSVPEAVIQRVQIGSGEVRKQLAVYYDCLKPEDRWVFDEVAEDLKLSSMNNTRLLAVLKGLSDLAIKHGAMLLGESWRMLVNLNLAFGAQPEDDESKAKFEEQVEHWVSKGSDVAEPLIDRGLELLKAKVGKVGKQKDWAEWMRSPSDWLANGASDVAALPGARKSKFATYAGSTASELADALLDESDIEYKVLVKRERGKMRNLITTPYSLHVQMSYASDGVMESLFGEEGSIPSSLNGGVSVSQWEHWMKILLIKTMIPIDQSTFDHVMKIVKRSGSERKPASIIKAIEIIEYMCGNDPLRKHVFSVIKRRLQNATVRYGDKVWDHTSGILSGWYWTAILGTMINYAEFLAVLELSGMPEPDKKDTNFQGDDNLSSVLTWDMAFSIVDIYKKYLPVNPKKFFLSGRGSELRTEYLRMVITPDKRVGYPARALGSLLYANAWAGGTVDARSIMDNWSLFSGRGMDPDICWKHCCRDLAGHLRMSVDSVADWMRTPSTVGGGGIWGRGVPSRLMVLERREAKLAFIGGRQVKVSPYSTVPSSVRELAESKLSTMYPRDIVKPVSASLFNGITGNWVAKDRAKEYLCDCDVKWATGEKGIGIWEGRGYSLPKVKTEVDPMFIQEIVSDNLQSGPTVIAEKIGADVDLLNRYWRVLPRAIFVEWLSGGIRLTVGRRWGNAPDVLGHLNSKLNSLAGVLPKFKSTTEDVRRWMLQVELYTSQWELDLRDKLLP